MIVSRLIGIDAYIYIYIYIEREREKERERESRGNQHWKSEKIRRILEEQKYRRTNVSGGVSTTVWMNQLDSNEKYAEKNSEIFVIFNELTSRLILWYFK